MSYDRTHPLISNPTGFAGCAKGPGSDLKKYRKHPASFKIRNLAVHEIVNLPNQRPTVQGADTSTILICGEQASLRSGDF